jgi:hypothetical protein
MLIFTTGMRLNARLMAFFTTGNKHFARVGRFALVMEVDTGPWLRPAQYDPLASGQASQRGRRQRPDKSRGQMICLSIDGFVPRHDEVESMAIQTRGKLAQP